MKSIWYTVYLLALSFLLTACPVTNEDDEINYEVYVKNESSAELEIKLYRDLISEPIDSFIITSGERRSICNYLSLGWASFACPISSVHFIFENGKGYECEKSFGVNVSDICFLNEKDPFDPPRPPDNGNEMLLIITEEDFENAYEL